MDVRVGPKGKLSTEELMLLNCGVGEDSWESLGLQGDQTVNSKGNQSWIFIGSWSWSFNTLATWSKELILWKRPWCWERLRAGGEGDDRGWDSWMHHWFDGHGFEQGPGVGDGQGSLASCSPWGCTELDMTEGPDWKSNLHLYRRFILHKGTYQEEKSPEQSETYLCSPNACSSHLLEHLPPLKPQTPAHSLSSKSYLSLSGLLAFWVSDLFGLLYIHA